MKNLLDLVEDFARAHFDKLLLTAILLLLVWIGASAMADSVKSWAMGQANTVIGAIIMLTTGKVIQSVRNGTTSTTTSDTTTSEETK